MNWAILGTGRIARKLAEAINEAEGAAAVAVGSRDGARAAAFAREFGIPKAYGSYEELLADPEVQVVYISLPNSLHAEWTARAAEAGKHILCEKPLGVSADEAAAMFEAARRGGIWLMEAFMYRFHPQTLKVQELLAAGAVGPVRLVRSSFSFSLPYSDTENVRLNAALAGGALMDVGCYPVNALRWITGRAPKRVAASAVWGASGVDELLSATCEYDGGLLGQIACGLRAGRHHTIQIAGEEGLIEVPEAFTPDPAAETVVRLWQGRASIPQEFRFPPVNQYRLEVEGFQRLISAGHGGPEQPLGETLDNMSTITALLTSAREGRAVEVAS